MKNKILILFLILTPAFLISCQDSSKGQVTIEKKDPNQLTFSLTKEEICLQDDKPIIRLFATTWCPHCGWIRDTYKNVVNEYTDQGKIVAYLWEVDIGDNSLTDELEIVVPESEKELFRKYNPQQSIPTFVFGCKYLRIGNAYEDQDDLEAEEREFRIIIDKLIMEVNK